MHHSPRIPRPGRPRPTPRWLGALAALALCGFCLVLPSPADEPPTDPAIDLEIELATARDAPLAAQRGWHDLLETLAPGRVRLRPFRGGEQPRVSRPESGSSDSIDVIAVITGDGALVVPGASFALSERSRARDWFATLSSPPSAPEVFEEFGLDPAARAELLAVLGRPLSHPTRGQDRWATYDRICQDLDIPVVPETAAEIAIRNARQAGPDPLADELQHLALGTGLAVLLDGAELGLRPEPRGAGRFRLVVTPLAGADRVWPLGTELTGSLRREVPKLHEFVDVDLPAQPFEQSLAWFTAQTELPVLVDRRAVAERGIDLANHLSTIPPKRTAWLMVIRGLAGPVRLRAYYRRDDANRPFLWLAPTFLSLVEKDRARRMAPPVGQDSP